MRWIVAPSGNWALSISAIESQPILGAARIVTTNRYRDRNRIPPISQTMRLVRMWYGATASGITTKPGVIP